MEHLPGVGEVTAKKIVAGRPYTKVDDLAKAGVPARTIDGIRSLVTVSRGPCSGGGCYRAGGEIEGDAEEKAAATPAAPRRPRSI